MLPEWILILTFVTFHGTSVEHIRGWNSQQECTTTGDKWKASIKKDMDSEATHLDIAYLASYDCVAQPQPVMK